MSPSLAAEAEPRASSHGRRVDSLPLEFVKLREMSSIAVPSIIQRPLLHVGRADKSHSPDDESLAIMLTVSVQHSYYSGVTVFLNEFRS